MKRAPLLLEDLWTKFYEAQVGIIKRFILLIITALKSILILLSDFEIVFNTIYIMFVVVGLTLHPFFFAFTLTDFLRTEYLKNVVKAVWQPRRELMLSLILFIILEYYFSLIGFLFYDDDYSGRCESFWICFITTFDWTFKSTGNYFFFFLNFFKDNFNY